MRLLPEVTIKEMAEARATWVKVMGTLVRTTVLMKKRKVTVVKTNLTCSAITAMTWAIFGETVQS